MTLRHNLLDTTGMTDLHPQTMRALTGPAQIQDRQNFRMEKEK